MPFLPEFYTNTTIMAEAEEDYQYLRQQNTKDGPQTP
jgi:hypothetical protein